MNLDTNGLLGGVHYTEALAASYGISQIGVQYKDVATRHMVEDYMSGLSSSLDSRSRLSGELIEQLGEPILLITRIWKISGLALNSSPESEDSTVTDFRPRQD